jgi:hypothetical protein
MSPEASEDPNSARAVVQTYVPEYQKAEWRRHAEDLDMSQSEFVRTMVQAGRRGFGGDESEVAEAGSEAVDPGGQDLETVVLDALSSADALDWTELLERVTADVERRLEDAVESLQADNRVRYSGPQGGYTLVEEP